MDLSFLPQQVILSQDNSKNASIYGDIVDIHIYWPNLPVASIYACMWMSIYVHKKWKT
jgi:hypothetical protein